MLLPSYIFFVTGFCWDFLFGFFFVLFCVGVFCFCFGFLLFFCKKYSPRGQIPDCCFGEKRDLKMASPSAPTADLTTVLLESAVPEGKDGKAEGGCVLGPARSSPQQCSVHSWLTRCCESSAHVLLPGSCWGVFLRVFAVMMCPGELASYPQLLLPLGCRAAHALARGGGSVFSWAPGESTASSSGYPRDQKSWAKTTIYCQQC